MNRIRKVKRASRTGNKEAQKEEVILLKIKNNKLTRKQVGLQIYGEPLLGPNTRFWPIEWEATRLAM